MTVYPELKAFAVGKHPPFGSSAQSEAKSARVLQSQLGLTKAVSHFSALMALSFLGLSWDEMSQTHHHSLF